MTPAANLPSVSLKPVANNGNTNRLLTPQSELVEKKFIYMLTLYILLNGVHKKCKNFLIEDVFDLPPVSKKKFETVLMGYSWAGGKLINKKNLKSKIS